MVDHRPNPPHTERTQAITPRAPRIALAHDWLCGFRGGEAVLERLCRLVDARFEPAGLYTMFDDGRPLAEGIDAWRARGAVRCPPRNLGPGAARRRRWMLPRYPAYVRWLSARLAEDHAERPIDLLLSTSSAAVKGIHPPPGVPHLCYCHSPARYVWSRRAEYGPDGSLKGRLRAAGLAAYAPAYRRWDRATAAHVTTFLANSSHTARELERTYGRRAGVVFPPVRTTFFKPSERAGGGYWLVVSALEPYKAVDAAVEAARRSGARLVVAGQGSQGDRLRELARGCRNVEFVGRVSDERLCELYGGAELLLFPQVEDFGIVAVEALACGCPVVARAEGGALDIVTDGVTGVLTADASPAGLIEAARRCADLHIDPRACRHAAQRFSEAVFDGAMLGAIRSALSGGPAARGSAAG